MVQVFVPLLKVSCLVTVEHVNKPDGGVDGRNQIYIPSSMVWEKSYSLGHATLM